MPTSWAEMIDYAVHSGGSEKISRTKIYAYLRDNFQKDMSDSDCKERFKAAMEKRMNDGYIEQDKQSFVFTAKGKKYYDEHYQASEEEEA